VDILDAIREQSGSQGVMDILALRNKKLAAKLAPRLENKSLDERIAEVAKIFSESGYMTEWELLPSGDFFIYQRHCAVHSLANQYRQLCALEPQLMQDLLGVSVIRQQYMLNSDPVCGYLVPAASAAR
jgi:predicted ArsR family transcriptional regulator